MRISTGIVLSLLRCGTCSNEELLKIGMSNGILSFTMRRRSSDASLGKSGKPGGVSISHSLSNAHNGLLCLQERKPQEEIFRSRMCPAEGFEDLN